MASMMTFPMLFGILLGTIYPNCVEAKTGGYVQSSFISTNGGKASGAAESSVIGPDGVKKGQCSYTSSEGDYVSIEYQEDSNGKIIDGKVTGGPSGAQLGESLNKCRSSISNLQENFQHSIDETNEQLADFENTFQQQMDQFNKQQQSFAQQQSSFLGNLKKFTSSLWK